MSGSNVSGSAELAAALLSSLLGVAGLEKLNLGNGAAPVDGEPKLNVPAGACGDAVSAAEASSMVKRCCVTPDRQGQNHSCCKCCQKRVTVSGLGWVCVLAWGLDLSVGWRCTLPQLQVAPMENCASRVTATALS